MTAPRHALTDAALRHAKPGRYNDGDGLSLRVRTSGARNWIVRVRAADGTRRDIGLGSYPTVSLAAARRLAAEAHDTGGRPDDVPAAPRPQRAPDARSPIAVAAAQYVEPSADAMTFARASRELAERNAAAGVWRDPDRETRKWASDLDRHASALQPMLVRDITRQHVRDVLDPIWHTTPVMAKRVRRLISQVIAYARALDPAILENPVEAVSGALIAPRRERQHRRAIHHGEVADALGIVARSATKPVALCLRWLVLTATRSAEARGARWSEIDFEARVWRIPGDRMKAGKPHTVPLSDQAVDVLLEAKSLDDGSGFVFAGKSATGMIGTHSMLRVLVDNAIDGTPHGFRTSFRSWALEQPGTSWAAAELAIAHKLGSDVEAVYVRDADLLAERRLLMQAWADYLDR